MNQTATTLAGSWPRFTVLSLMVALGGCLQSCTRLAPAPPPTTSAVGQQQVSQAEQMRNLLAALDRRDHALSAMQTPAVMEYRGGNEHIKAREQISIRRPQDLRVEAYSPLGVALVVAANNTGVVVYEPSHNLLIKGPPAPQTLAQFARIPLRPVAAVRLLLGLLPDEAISKRIPDDLRTDNDLLVAVYRNADGGSMEIGFAGEDLAMVRSISPDPGFNYSVRYYDYSDIGGLVFPQRLEASFPGAGATLKVNYQRPIINPRLADSFFVLNPVGAAVRYLSPAPARIPTAHAASDG